MEYGLIGYPLKHSFSKEIHNLIGKFTNDDYRYELLELKEEELDVFLTQKDFKAINVTIPYKQKVIPYLDEINEVAKEIGAVNLIVNENERLIGYNTDYYGLRVLVESFKKTFTSAAILGTGGTSNTSKKVLKDLGINYILASRNPEKGIMYENLKNYDLDLIINTTPCGMFPKNEEKIIDANDFANLKGYVDVIYNPLKTMSVLDFENKGIKVATGLKMLVIQAIKAYEIFKSTTLDCLICDKIYNKILKAKQNIVLIGMPSCGKTTIGTALSSVLGKTFVDVDEEIEKKEGLSIKEIFARFGEDYFRCLESKMILEISKQSNLVISTGGGVIKNEQNMMFLKQNGIVIFLNRSLDKLITTSSRPLSSNKEDLKKLYDERIFLYQKYKDIEINGDLEISEIIKIIGEKYENFSD